MNALFGLRGLRLIASALSPPPYRLRLIASALAPTHLLLHLPLRRALGDPVAHRRRGQIAFHRLDQIAGIEGLRDVVARSRQFATHLIEDAIFTAEHNDGQITIRQILADNLTDIVAIHTR